MNGRDLVKSTPQRQCAHITRDSNKRVPGRWGVELEKGAKPKKEGAQTRPNPLLTSAIIHGREINAVNLPVF
jgi:hypothetical protein